MILRNANKTKVNFRIKRIQDGETDAFELYVVQSFEISGSNNIVVTESATGNSGITYNTGRLHEEVPINGVLLGIDKDDLQEKMDKLDRFRIDGSVIQLIRDQASVLRSNQYYIKTVTFVFNPGETDRVTFSMVLSENRSANVRTTQVSLVNFGVAEFYKEYYRDLEGINS